MGRFCVWGRGEWIYSLRLLHVQTVPNCKAVWCGVCDVCVWSVCVVLHHSAVSVLSPPVSPPYSCIMWSGWTCIVIRPYGGGGVSESAWRRLNNSKQSFLSMGAPLGQTRFKCGSVLVSAWRWADFKSWHDTRILISKIDFEKPFLCILFSIFTSFGCFTFLFFFLKSVMVQIDSSLLFTLFWIMILISCFCSPLYFKSLVVLSFLVVMLHPSKESDHILNGVQTLKLISWIVFWWSSVTLCSFCIKKTWIGNHGPNIKLFSCFKCGHWGVSAVPKGV